MSLPELSIRRPVMTTLITLSFVVFGLFAYRALPVAALPRVDFPTISVNVQFPGASAETMAASVAAPLERQFGTIPGVTALTSLSGQGYTNITLQFDLDRSIDGAALDVQSAISASQRRLPQDLPAPPSYRKVNPADSPIMFLTLTSNTLPLSTVNDYGDIVLSQQISQVPGVAQVVTFGPQKYAVRVRADPDALAARGLTFADLQRALAATNSNQPVGTLLGDRQNLTLQATGQLRRAADYGNLVIAYRNGAPVRLNEVGRAIDSVEDDQRAGWFNNERSITLAVFRQSDANTVEVVDKIRASIPGYQAQIPPAVTLRVVSDRSISIRESVADVQFTLMLSVGLVVLVIFLFLKRLSATLIPALVLPVSLLGTCCVMYAFGYSIDNISLLALTLSVGFVVDDAIVMLENIVRHIEKGMKPYEAALKGSREIAFTIISITFSLVAVFIPVLFMGGVVGRIFREFAVTISAAILVSGFVSLTLTPMLCARLLRAEDHHKRPNLFERAVDRSLDGVLAAYRWSLDLVLKGRLIVLALTVGSLWLTVVLYGNIPKGFFPQEDTGIMFATTEAAPDSSLAAMIERQKQVSAIVRADPAIEYATSAVGARGGPNTGQMFINLKPKDQRPSVFEVIARLRGAVARVPGITTVFQPIQNVNLNAGRASRSLYQYTLQSADTVALYEAAPRMKELMERIPGLRDVVTDLQITNPQIFVDIDRERAATYGITVEQVRTTLYSAFGSRQVSTIFTPATDYQVILESDRDFQSDPNALARLYLRSSDGRNVPLDQVASLRRGVGPLVVNRQSQQPAVTISFNLAPGVALSDAVAAVRGAERDANLTAAVTTAFSGTAQLFQEGLKNQPVLILAAVLVIYIVLGVLYESFVHPITILSGLPSAGLGALIALQYFNMDLSVIAIIGILLLVGIVKKNAIMMVDFAIERRREGGVDALEAIREAALVRFRPIMMTTLAAIFGTLPIALGHGAGSELRQPLGIAVVGGLLVSQLLTLYITPVVYYYLDKVETSLSGRGRGKAREAAPVIVGAPVAVGAPGLPARD